MSAVSQQRSLPRVTVRDLALITSFTALIAVCAILPAIKVGGPVGITLQTFAVLLTGAVLGPWRAFLSVSLYLLIGGLGLPVFSEGKSGFGVFLTGSVGYLVAFVLAATLCGFLVQQLHRRNRANSVLLVFLAGLGSSLVLVHPLGVAGLVWRAEMTWWDAFVFDARFYPGDVVKNLVMAAVAVSVHRAFPDLLGTPRRAASPERETIDA